ncbi:hypothetical protein [Haloarchaeobius amylolyticus]|uniref:hypothetical protein n=1 Tax=Haloarchaeobius amylolyticus TaxID=1198296 RepID=UPI00227082A4|nr:hypothetical protein [Haloarchaeobius amylolyticus]
MRLHTDALAALAVAALLLTAGCLGTAAADRQPDDGAKGPGLPFTYPDHVVADVPMQTTTQVGVCAPVTDPTSIALSTAASDPGVTVTVTGQLAVTDASSRVTPAVLAEPEPGRYVLFVASEPIADAAPAPCADGGHVPYEVVVTLPHDSPDEFDLTVMHIEPAGSTGTESA